MTVRRGLEMALAVGLAAVFGVRALTGIQGGLAMVRADWLSEQEENASALYFYEHAKVGGNSYRATRKAGDERLILWNRQAREQGYEMTDPRLLDGAVSDFVDCLLMAPTEARPWTGLARIYEAVEEKQAAQRALEAAAGPAASPGQARETIGDGWRRIGFAGRVAIGMLRLSASHAPNWYSAYDRLARLLWDYGQRRESLEAVAESARTLPIWARHDRFQTEDIPEEMVDAFAEQAWSRIGEPYFVDSGSQLVSLARLERFRGAYGRAYAALRAAGALPGDEVARAEVEFLTGAVLVATGRHGLAQPYLEAAAQVPRFAPGCFFLMAYSAEVVGEVGRAAELMGRARWAVPDNLEYALGFARLSRIAGKLDRAEEAAAGAMRLAPEDPRPLFELFEIQLARSDRREARKTLDRLEAMGQGVDAYRRRLDD